MVTYRTCKTRNVVQRFADLIPLARCIMHKHSDFLPTFTPRYLFSKTSFARQTQYSIFRSQSPHYRNLAPLLAENTSTRWQTLAICLTYMLHYSRKQDSLLNFVTQKAEAPSEGLHPPTTYTTDHMSFNLLAHKWQTVVLRHTYLYMKVSYSTLLLHHLKHSYRVL